MADFDASQLTRDELLKHLEAEGADLSWFGQGNGNVSGEGYKPVTEEDRQTKWMDYPKAAATGITSAISGAGALAEYATDGQYGTDLRKTGEGWTKGISDTISPAGQHAANASFLPGEGDDSAYKEGILRTVGMQGAASLFSLASSIIPGTLAGKIALRIGSSAATAGAVGAGVARGSAALQNAGGSAEQIHSALDKMTDAQLMESPAYRQLREQGISEQDARSRLYQKVDGIAPVLNGAITFMLAAPEAGAAKAGITGAAKRQGVKGAVKVAGQEAGEEFVEGAAQEATSEQALADAKLGTGLDAYKIAGQAITGAVTGAAMGAGTGLYTHGFVAPDQKAAIDASLGTKPEQPKQAVQVPNAPVSGSVSVAPEDMQIAPSSGGQPTVPEKPVTLDIQAQQLANGERAAMLIPEGNPANVPLPQGMASLDTSEGMVYYDPRKIGAEAVMSAAIDGRIGDLLGYVQTKPEAVASSAQQDMPPVGVVSRNAQGVEQDAAVVSPDQVANQAQVFAQRAQPGSTVAPEPVDQTLGSRVAPPDIAERMNRVAPQQDDIGDAGLNRLPQEDDQDLIAYDDGTVRRTDEPSAPIRQSRPMWPEAGAFSVSPQDQADADEYYAERNTDPLEGPAQDDDFEPSVASSEPAPRNTQTPAPVADDTQDTFEVTPKGGTTTASKRRTRRGEAALIAAKSREARYVALQKSKAPASTPFRDRLQKTISAIEGLKREPTRQEREKLEWAKRRLAGRTKPQGKIGATVINILSKRAPKADEQKSKSPSHEKLDTQRAREKLASAAKKAFAENVVVDENDTQPDQLSLINKRKFDPRDISTGFARQRLKQRLKKLVGAVEKSGGPLPPNASKNTPDHVLYAMVARKVASLLDSNSTVARDRAQMFLAADFAARKGDFSLLHEMRKYEAGDAIGTAGMESRAEVAAEPTDDEVVEPDAKAVDVGEEAAAGTGDRRAEFHEALIQEIKRQIDENKSVDYGALKAFATKTDPKLAAKLDFASPESIQSWVSRETEHAERRTRSKKQKAAAPQVRRVQVSEEEKARLVRELEAAGKAKPAAPEMTYEQFVEAQEREATQKETSESTRALTDGERRLQIEDDQKRLRDVAKKLTLLRTATTGARLTKASVNDTSAPQQLQDIAQLEEEANSLQARVARNKQALQGDKNTFGPLLSKGAFSETERAEAEARALSEGVQTEYAEGLANEQSDPSVFQIGDNTYLASKTGAVPVQDTFTVGDLLDRGFRYGPTNPRLTEFVMALIRKNAADVPVHIVSMSDLDRLWEGSDGYYHPAGYIVLPRELANTRPETYNHVVIHEALHAALQKKIDENPVATAQLHALAEFIKQEGRISQDAYLWENIHEFVSEVLSRSDFQEVLRNTQLTPELAKMLEVNDWRQKTVWRALVEKIADWLGYRGPMNALEGVLSAVERADRGDLRTNQQVAEYTRMGWPHSREEVRSFGPLASKGALSRENVTNQVTDAIDTAGSKNRRAQLLVKTLDQIRQTFGKYFVDSKGDALNDAVAAIQKMGPYAGKKREAFDRMAQRFIDLQRAKPDVVDDLVDLMINATTANVQLGDGATNDHLKGWHSWQGKLAKPGLEADYNRLKAKSPEAAKLYNDMKQLFRDTQNEMARNMIAADLSEAGVKPPNLDKFIDRVIENKLTEADKNLFAGKPTALKNILDAAQARVMKGDYFPLMRNGHNVVVTINEIKDTMGGNEVEKGKVEFRGKTFKQAQAKAEAFAKKMFADGLPVISVTPTPVSTDSDYGVVVHVQRLGFHAFETEGEARRWRRENEGDFDQISEVQKGLETGLNPADLTVSQRNRIFNAIKRQPGISDDMKDAMSDVFQQVAAGMMSGNRIQQRSIARRRVKGASRDYGRILVQYSEAATNNLARIKFMPEYREAYDRMSAQAKNTMHKNAPVMVDVLNEVNKRFDTGVEKPSEPPRWMQTLMSLTFLGRLASPMHSVVNGMQVGMVTYPVLAAKFKPARAGQALLEAYGAVGLGEQVMAGVRNTFEAGKKLTSVSLSVENTADNIKKNLASQKDGAELASLIDMLQERGAMSEGGFELAQSISRGAGKTGMIIAQLDRAARQLPSAVEDINRSVSAVAAYRLARSNGMTVEAAKSYAFDVVMNTQGDYSGVNAPRFFNNSYLRPALQFKKYAQMMTVLLADGGHKAVMGASKEERKEAAMFLANIVGVQIAMAGALSLPGIELAKLGFIIAAALGVGDGWDDEEERLVKLAEETFGEDWGRMLTKGVLSRAANIDLSQKLSLADMYTPLGEPESSSTADVAAYFAKFIGGATYSTVDDIRKGAIEAGKGNFASALSHILPVKVVADAVKAGKSYSEGKATEVEVLMNTLGVRSGRQAEQGRKAGTGARESRQNADEYRDLAQEYLKAQNAGERAKVRARIVEHNKKSPLRYRVFPHALDQLRTRIEAERIN